MMKTLNAILINPFEMTVSGVDYTGETEDLYRLIEARPFFPFRFDKKNTMYLDDNGIYRDPSRQAFFMFGRCKQPLTGRALIVGRTRGGYDASTKLSVKFIQNNVRWVSRDLATRKFGTGAFDTKIVFGDKVTTIPVRLNGNDSGVEA